MTDTILQVPQAMNHADDNAQILLVDDDRELGQMITDFLASDHLDVTTRHSGESGLDEFRSGNYDLLILDIIGLEFGADDYLPKPFNPRELVARIKAILRRAQPRTDEVKVLELGDIRLDTRTHRAQVGGSELKLTGTEFEILKCLLETPGKVVNKEFLSERALGRRLLPYDRSVDTHISNLRGKLEKAGNQDATIQNQRGVGYLLIPGT